MLYCTDISDVRGINFILTYEFVFRSYGFEKFLVTTLLGKNTQVTRIVVKLIAFKMCKLRFEGHEKKIVKIGRVKLYFYPKRNEEM